VNRLKHEVGEYMQDKGRQAVSCGGEAVY